LAPPAAKADRLEDEFDFADDFGGFDDLDLQSAGGVA
jgi:hypothetical protein